MPQTTPAVKALDHLLLGIADLEAGIAWVERMTGIRARAGGVHPGVGTRNALLSLGNHQYLEILALDPAQQTKGWLAEMVQHLKEPKLVTWAAATQSAKAIAEQARVAGHDSEGPRDGARALPNGQVLKWQTVSVTTDLGGVIPFFIAWGATTLHPSRMAPAGCRLVSFTLQHPQPERVQATLQNLGIEAAVKRGDEARLVAVLSTPKGEVVLQ